MTPDIPQDARSSKKISGHPDRVLAQNLDTVLDMVVKLAGEALFKQKVSGGLKTYSKPPIKLIYGYCSKQQYSENRFPR